jgi:hypothetical protein
MIHQRHRQVAPQRRRREAVDRFVHARRLVPARARDEQRRLRRQILNAPLRRRVGEAIPDSRVGHAGGPIQVQHEPVAEHAAAYFAVHQSR